MGHGEEGGTRGENVGGEGGEAIAQEVSFRCEQGLGRGGGGGGVGIVWSKV